jgi:membrane associated rhomboid family serine protease
VLFPVRDRNPRARFPIVTLLLVAANALLFLFELALDGRGQKALILTAGAIPYEIINGVDIGPRDLLPPPWTLLTSMFLHGGWMHLLGNMWFLWLFGDNVEEALGRFRYVAFYFLAGVVGGLAQSLCLPQSTVPMIGASGAIAGLLGGYVMLYPRVSVVTFVALPFFWQFVDLPAWIFLGIWFIGQFLLPMGSGVAWMAHVGGFLAGAGAVRLLAAAGARPPSRPSPSRTDGGGALHS